MRKNIQNHENISAERYLKHIFLEKLLFSLTNYIYGIYMHLFREEIIDIYDLRK